MAVVPGGDDDCVHRGIVEHLVGIDSASFPSGHSMLSAVVYLTIGALIARVRPNPRVRVYILVLSALVTIIVGISRVYLGVHWPTDVLAGWAVGLAMFLPVFALRGIGGGDVKLVAALGAWIGPGAAVWLALWAAVAGGPGVASFPG